VSVRIWFASDDWTPDETVVARIGSGDDGNDLFHLHIIDGFWRVWNKFADGNVFHQITPQGFGDGTFQHIRVDVNPNNGSSQKQFDFYKSSDGTNWTLISSLNDAGASTFSNTSGVITIGNLAGNYRSLQVIDGSGTKANPDFRAHPGETSFTDAAGVDWDLNGNAEIA
jgi:hypothetical protein